MKILITIGFAAVYRFGSFVVLPGINPNQLVRVYDYLHIAKEMRLLLEILIYTQFLTYALMLAMYIIGYTKKPYSPFVICLAITAALILWKNTKFFNVMGGMLIILLSLGIIYELCKVLAWAYRNYQVKKKENKN